MDAKSAENKVIRWLAEDLLRWNYDCIVVVNLQDMTAFWMDYDVEKGFFPITDLDAWTEKYLRRHYEGDDLELVLRTTRLESIVRAVKKNGNENISYSINVDGQIKRKIMQAQFLPEDHSILYVVWRDVTKEYGVVKQKEQVLEKALDIAQKANQVKKEFLLHISRDIGVPLYELSGILQRLEKKQTGEEDFAYIRKAMEDVKKLQTIFENLLDVSAAETDDLAIVEEAVAPQKLIQEIADELEKQACKKAIRVIFEVKPTNFPLVMLDPARWKQIIMNIMQNSIQYGKNGGYTRCRIDTELMAPGWEIVTLRFTDDGPGMEDAFCRTVFQDFACYDEENRGSGLGLPLVQHIVDNMGGRMQLSSRPGEGTAVTIRLPVRSADAQDYEKTKKIDHMIQNLNKADFSKFRVLVVDDSCINRELMCVLLERIGVQVETAEDGEQAVRKLRESDIGYYQIVFMAMQMPNKDGVEAAMEIRNMERPDLSDITLVAVTAHAFRNDRLRILEAGVDYHMALPLNQTALKEILVRELIENDQPREFAVRGFRIIK
ncbi:response regulator [Kineothrix sp. MSJ-39]|uniref:hybrid sensor histidine kinase/response regulator n=1 Tax=Kineothrix sp. MSJ-39 TaxID=2841533 RepID=UPI001C10CF9F|nr:ATP-binding protein [Kineothrix sp. MSJ-39]MBU5430642.1 response regulator [Kineothrix sp. MSJ-39]